jgi:hypothetical protein
MATPRSRHVRISDLILDEDWPDWVLATVVRLIAWLRRRWAREHLTAAEAVEAVISARDAMRITRTHRPHVALRRLAELPLVAGLSSASAALEHDQRGTRVRLTWPKVADYQGWSARESGRDEPEDRPLRRPGARRPAHGTGEGERPAAAPPPAGGAPAPRSRRRARTEPPAALSPEALAALERWARETLRRPDLAARVPELVAACLDYHRGRGTLAADWSATARTWIRREAQWTRPSAGRSPAAPGSVAARRERAGELYRDDLLAEPTEAALAAWEAAGAPRERGWWLAPAERERLQAARSARHAPRRGGAHAAA